MALVWEHESDGVLYQVRRHGASLRLYANGVQHSEYHPDRLVTGSVWDLLWLPALLQAPKHTRRVLMLGLGGGSLMPPLRALFSPQVLVAVEKDPWHLSVARKIFSVVEDAVAEGGTDIVLADAVDWLQAYSGPPFDLIIEDLFAPRERSVRRAVAADERWLELLTRHVSAQGVLVMNFGDFAEYRASFSADRLLAGWAGRFHLSCGDCHNAVIAHTRRPARSVELRRRLQRHPQLAPLLRSGQLDYQIRQLQLLPAHDIDVIRSAV